MENEKERVLTEVKENVRIFETLDEETFLQLTEDREFMLQAIEKNKKAFFYVCSQLKFDRNFVLEAMIRNEELLEIKAFENLIPEMMKRDRKFIDSVLILNLLALKKEIKGEKDKFSIEIVKEIQEKAENMTATEIKNQLKEIRRLAKEKKDKKEKEEI